MSIRNNFPLLPAFSFLMLGLVLFPGCGGCPGRQEAPATPAAASPAPPASDPSASDPSAFSLETCIFGYFDTDDSPPWISPLHEHLKADIGWGLAKRQPDLSDMVKIPGREMWFGCRRDKNVNIECLSQQKRRVISFFIDRNEVTNAKYNRCVQEERCLPVLPQPHIAGADEPDRPALLTFKQAERYCLWAGKRLPTEVEWEMAARGTDGRLYPWGDRRPTPKDGNICGKECSFGWADPNWSDGYEYAAPVGSYPKGNSPFGLTDMAGNVKEWVRSDSPLPENHFIARGASWYSPQREMFVFYRQAWVPQTRVDDKGVRCAADANE